MHHAHCQGNQLPLAASKPLNKSPVCFPLPDSKLSEKKQLGLSRKANIKELFGRLQTLSLNTLLN